MHLENVVRANLGAGILVPLYLFPTSCSDWGPLISTIPAYPNVTFTVIVNPNSGPGTQGGQPVQAYQDCVPQLKQPNSILVGYVLTGKGNRSETDVQEDINTYAGWASTYRPDGIFFADASSSADDLNKYKGYVDFARSNFTDGLIVLSPGDQPDAGYFEIADLIVTDEDFFSNFGLLQLTIIANAPASKQAVILHDSTSSSPTDLINQLLRSNFLRISALYITDDSKVSGDMDPYNSFPTFWNQFVADVATAAIP